MKFDMGRAWSEAVAMLSANRQVVLIVAGVFFFLPYLALVLLLPESMGQVEADNSDPGAALEAAGALYAEYWWAMLLLGVIQGIGMLGLLALLTDRNRPTVGEALAGGARFFLPYLGTQLLVAAGAVLIVMIPFAVGASAGAGAGLLLGLIAAVLLTYLLVKFSLSTPVIVVERVMNPIRALGRSWALTKGNSLRLFLFYFLLFIVLIVVSMVLGIVVGLVTALSGADAAVLVSGLINGLLNMVAVTVILAVLAAAHRQLSGASSPAVSEAFE